MTIIIDNELKAVILLIEGGGGEEKQYPRLLRRSSPPHRAPSPLARSNDCRNSLATPVDLLNWGQRGLVPFSVAACQRETKGL